MIEFDEQGFRAFVEVLCLLGDSESYEVGSYKSQPVIEEARLSDIPPFVKNNNRNALTMKVVSQSDPSKMIVET